MTRSEQTALLELCTRPMLLGSRGAVGGSAGGSAHGISGGAVRAEIAWQISPIG